MQWPLEVLCLMLRIYSLHPTTQELIPLTPAFRNNCCCQLRKLLICSQHKHVTVFKTTCSAYELTARNIYRLQVLSVAIVQSSNHIPNEQDSMPNGVLCPHNPSQVPTSTCQETIQAITILSQNTAHDTAWNQIVCFRFKRLH